MRGEPTSSAALCASGKRRSDGDCFATDADDDLRFLFPVHFYYTLPPLAVGGQGKERHREVWAEKGSSHREEVLPLSCFSRLPPPAPHLTSCMTALSNCECSSASLLASHAVLCSLSRLATSPFPAYFSPVSPCPTTHLSGPTPLHMH